ncbi:MAG: hypothetical protein KAH32_02455 [Chlamydiia bacterium]|nr:hypothetical protein [Chlamydiia bacterium]
MIAILMSCISGAVIGINNFIFSKASRSSEGVLGYLFVCYSLAAILMFMINSIIFGFVGIPAISEIIVGIILGSLLYLCISFFGKALKVGNLASTSAIFASASITSPIVSYAIFGEQYIAIRWFNLVALAFSTLGIFYPVIFQKDSPESKSARYWIWMKYIIFAFSMHVTYMVLVFWRVNSSLYYGKSMLFFVDIPEASVSIDVIGYMTAGALFLINNLSEKFRLNKEHVYLGIPSALLFAISHLLIIFAMACSSPEHTVLIWPLFSIFIMLTTAAISKLIMDERVNMAQILILCFAVGFQIPFIVTV